MRAAASPRSTALVVLAAATALVTGACERKRSDGQAAAGATAPVAAPAPATATGPAAGGHSLRQELVGVWSRQPEPLGGPDDGMRAFEILRADGTREWREAELECSDLVRTTGTWTVDGDRLTLVTTHMTGWDGGEPHAPGCDRPGHRLTTSAQAETETHPVERCPSEVEYPSPYGELVTTSAAALRVPCRKLGAELWFKVATIEDLDGPGPPALPAAPSPAAPVPAGSEDALRRGKRTGVAPGEVPEVLTETLIDAIASGGEAVAARFVDATAPVVEVSHQPGAGKRPAPPRRTVHCGAAAVALLVAEATTAVQLQRQGAEYGEAALACSNRYLAEPDPSFGAWAQAPAPRPGRPLRHATCSAENLGGNGSTRVLLFVPDPARGLRLAGVLRHETAVADREQPWALLDDGLRAADAAGCR